VQLHLAAQVTGHSRHRQQLRLAVAERGSASVLPASNTLPIQTRDFAATLFTQVAEAYLAFRHEHYREDHPVLTSPPPLHAEVRHNELAVLAENTLRLVTPAVKSLPILGGLLEHLEEVVNIHTITEVERTDLHNLTVTFLYRIQGGIQPWFIEWCLTSARHLAQVSDEHYFMRFPWDACLYLDGQELAELEAAVREDDGKEIERFVRKIADQLTEVLLHLSDSDTPSQPRYSVQVPRQAVASSEPGILLGDLLADDQSGSRVPSTLVISGER
jgi:hypothetical protein